MPITSGDVQAVAEDALKVAKVKKYAIPCVCCETNLVFKRLECINLLRLAQQELIDVGAKEFDNDEEKWLEIEQLFVTKEALLEVGGKVDVHPLTMVVIEPDTDDEKHKHVHVCRECGEREGYKMGGELRQ